MPRAPWIRPLSLGPPHPPRREIGDERARSWDCAANYALIRTSPPLWEHHLQICGGLFSHVPPSFESLAPYFCL